MSDPVSSMDVEDVLSSIRRLVSEEAKSVDGSGDAGSHSSEDETSEEMAQGGLTDIVQAIEENSSRSPMGVPPSNETDLEDDDEADDVIEQVSFRHNRSPSSRREQDEKLVLTAAFRVKEDAVIEDDESEKVEAAGDEENSIEEANSTHPHLRSVDNLNEENPDETLQEITETVEETEPVKAKKPSPFRSSPEDVLFDRAEQVMDAVHDTQGSAGSGSAGSGGGASSGSGIFNVAELIRGSSSSKGAETVPSADEGSVISEEEGQETADTALDDTAAVGAENSYTEETPEISDGAFADDEQETAATSPFSKTGNAFNIDENISESAETQPQDEPSTINFAEEDSSLLDEDNLRDLVSDLVRDELQGELGDRITRNVRKLVRREIQRALASREFE